MDDTDPNLEIVDALRAPLCEASESEINAVVDQVLRTGKHHTLPKADGSRASERLHARAIADQMQRLAHQLVTTPDPLVEGPDDLDEWWFEVDERRMGPISLRKARYLWEDGVLTPDSLCWHDGFSSWVSLFRVSELAEALAPRTASPAERLGAAATVDVLPEVSPPAEPNWMPNAGASLEEANRRRLAATQAPPPRPSAPVAPRPAAPRPVAPIAVDDAPTLLQLETLPSPDPADASKKRRRRSRMSHAIVNGLARGAAVAAAMVALRFALPHAGIDTPLVVVMREMQAPAPVAAAAAAPASASVSTSAPTPVAVHSSPQAVAAPASTRPQLLRPKHAAAAIAPVTTRAMHPRPAAATKPADNEDAFAQEFAPNQDALETSEIFETVAAHKPEVNDCIRAQKAAAPGLSGRLVMRWWVALDGRVTDVEVRSSDLAGQPLADCLRTQIAGWTFPKHEVPHAPIDFPFVF